MNWKYLSLIFIVGLLVACRNSPSESECKYGTPKAIFSATQQGIKTHQFVNPKKDAAVEQVTFDDSLQLTLLQSGCDHVRQEFQFILPGDFINQKPEFWIELSIGLLRRLGSMGPDYAVFSAWAQSIESQKDAINLAENTALQQGFYVKIDRILADQSATLVLILSDEP